VERARIRKPKARAKHRSFEVLALDPRDQDIVRARASRPEEGKQRLPATTSRSLWNRRRAR
jgi:hypothetical protein